MGWQLAESESRMRGALADVSKQEPDPEDVWTEQGIGTFFSRAGASKLFFLLLVKY